MPYEVESEEKILEAVEEEPDLDPDDYTPMDCVDDHFDDDGDPFRGGRRGAVKPLVATADPAPTSIW